MITVWCLHGNLQQASVWWPIQNQLKKSKDTYFSHEIIFINENIWQNNALGFDDWATQFCEKVEKNMNGSILFLVGYSLGGRLALHALLKNSTLWRGAVIIGADTGFTSTDDCHEQSLRDAQWAKRFLSEPWDELLAEWDSLGVFCQIPCLVERKENDFSREKIAKIFTVFSKSRQHDLLPYFKTLNRPEILFLSGEKDHYYSDVGEKFSTHCPTVSHQIIPFSGHRVPWENSSGFSDVLLSFISQQMEEIK